MDKHAPDTSSISFTALYTGQVWVRNGLSEPFFQTRSGALLYGAMSPMEALGKRVLGGNIRTFLLQRHHLIDARLEALIEQHPDLQVVEIACGLSPRGCRFRQRFPSITYVEADLPDMADRKRRLLAAKGFLSATHRVAPVNILAEDGPDSVAALLDGLDPARPVAVITEGLINYFSLDTVTPFWGRLAAGLRRLAADPDAQVRYQLGWTLGVVRIPGKAVALATLLRHGAGDRWQQVAALNAATENHSEIIKSLTTDEAFAGSKVSTRIVTRLETMAAGRLAKVSASSAGEYHVQVFKPKTKVNPDRARVIEQFRPALAKRGSAAAGKATFEQRCAVCHELGGVGRAIGPDLKSTRANGAEKMLVSLIDPNREVAPQYLLFTVHLAKGDGALVGMIANENASVVELIQPDGSAKSVRRAGVRSIESTGLSLMPAGLEAGLSAGQMADLLAWVLEAP